MLVSPWAMYKDEIHFENGFVVSDLGDKPQFWQICGGKINLHQLYLAKC